MSESTKTLPKRETSCRALGATQTYQCKQPRQGRAACLCHAHNMHGAQQRLAHSLGRNCARSVTAAKPTHPLILHPPTLQPTVPLPCTAYHTSAHILALCSHPDAPTSTLALQPSSQPVLTRYCYNSNPLSHAPESVVVAVSTVPRLLPAAIPGARRGVEVDQRGGAAALAAGRRPERCPSGTLPLVVKVLRVLVSLKA